MFMNLHRKQEKFLKNREEAGVKSSLRDCRCQLSRNEESISNNMRSLIPDFKMNGARKTAF